MKKNIIFFMLVLLLSNIHNKVNASPLTLKLSSDYYSFVNPDMIVYDEDTYSKNQAYQDLNTDDDISFALTTIQLGYNKKYLNSEIFIKMRFEGFWGNDNLGENSKNTSIFYDNIYTNFYFTKNSYIGIGRMNYTIGDAITDYFFDDIIDGAIVKYKSEFNGYPFEAAAMTDITGMASRPEDSDRFSYIQKDEVEIDDFQGDTLSTRFGADATFWFFKTFVYYTRYAASREGGTDIAQNGDTPVNKVDGDYLTVGGCRLFYDFKRWGKTDFTYAYSKGSDFQYAANKEYSGSGIVLNYSGDAIAIGGLSDNIVKNALTVLSVGYFSEGYCGMKGATFNDSLLDEYYGYSVAPYAGAYHFYDYAKIEDAKSNTDKTVAKTFYKLVITTVFRIGIELDLGLIILNANEDGESGIKMGNEYITALRYTMNNVVFSGAFNYFAPGEYYSNLAETNPYIPSGEDPFYSFKFSFASKFTIIE